jgi:hypothetical protein
MVGTRTGLSAGDRPYFTLLLLDVRRNLQRRRLAESFYREFSVDSVKISRYNRHVNPRIGKY